MRKSRLTLAVAGCGGLAAAALAAAFVVPAVAEGSTSCSTGTCFKVAATPGSIGAGVTAGANSVAPYTFSVTNESSRQRLTSVTISPPSGFVITAVPSPGTIVAGSAVFNGLSVGSLPISLTVDAAAPCADGSGNWTVKAGPNDGDNDSDDFSIDPGNSTLGSLVTGTCKLAFDSTGQPTGTEPGHPITSATDSTGGPLVVDVNDANGNLITTGSAASASVNLTLNPNPANGTLSGAAVPFAASKGQAQIAGLSVNNTGDNYTLQATTGAAGIAAGTSNPFSVYSSLGGCTGTCSGSASSTTTTGLVTTSGGTGEFLGVGVGGFTFTCNGSYKPTSDPISFDLLNSSGGAQQNAQFTDVLEVSKATVLASGHPGASTWQICYASTQPGFTVLAGTGGTATIGGVTYYTGLLPDCSSPAVAPCVQARNKTNAGVEVVTFLATGDPVWRG